MSQRKQHLSSSSLSLPFLGKRAFLIPRIYFKNQFNCSHNAIFYMQSSTTFQMEQLCSATRQNWGTGYRTSHS